MPPLKRTWLCDDVVLAVKPQLSVQELRCWLVSNGEEQPGHWQVCDLYIVSMARARWKLLTLDLWSKHNSPFMVIMRKHTQTIMATNATDPVIFQAADLEAAEHALFAAVCLLSNAAPQHLSRRVCVCNDLHTLFHARQCNILALC